jgi:predicted cupin superfamily sugar epimerase
VVPAGWYQAVRSTGTYTLCGCTVAPAFQFSGFRFLLGEEPEKLKALHPDAALFC